MKKIIRVVTSNYCIPAHLDNTLRRIPADYQLYIVGDNVSVYSSDYRNVVFVDLEIKRNFSAFSDLLALFKLVALFRRIKPDIVHSLMVKAGLLSALAGIFAGVRVRVHTYTGQLWANKDGLAKYFLKTVDKLISQLNTDCLTDSPSQSDFLYRNGIHICNRPIKCLSRGSLSGVDLERFSNSSTKLRTELSAALKLTNSDFVIGYIARKSVDKGCLDMLESFIRVLAQYSGVKLLFVGPDESQGQIERFFDMHPEAKESITQIGFVHDHENYLALCKILCLPSHREGFGSIVIDAGALSIPTIGYRIPGLVDSVVDGVTGALVDLGDIQGFSDAIMAMLENPERLRAYGSNARSYVENYFDADIINMELYKFYDSLGRYD